MRNLPHQETDCSKPAAFGSGLFSENPKPPPAPFSLCLRTRAGGGFSQGWDVVGAGQGSRAPRPFQAGIIGMEKSLTRRRPRSRHTAWSWSRPAAPRSAGTPGSSPRAAARLGKDGVGSSLSQGDAPETLPGLQIPPGTRAGGFSFGSISTCRMESGSHRLKANTGMS